MSRILMPLFLTVVVGALPAVALAQEAEAAPPAADPMVSALGYYPMTRDASGTAWQPDSSEHAGIHTRHGEWTVMVHGLLNGVYDSQSGPRGDQGSFVSGMFMAMAKRPLGRRRSVAPSRYGHRRLAFSL